MSSSESLPPARERNRQGIRSYSETAWFDASDALIDRAQLTVTGTLHAKSPEAIRQFAEAIGTGTADALFGRARADSSRRWVAKAKKSTTISHAELTAWEHPERSGFKMVLTINPIRTLSHLLDAHTFEEIAGLTPWEFFAKRTQPRAAQMTLDGQDNMVADFLAFGGTVHSTYVQRVATYLGLFERALVFRLLDELCPMDQGYGHRRTEDAWEAESDDLTVRLMWGQLNVSQCEVCWERNDPEALARAHALADDMLLSARSVEVPLFAIPGTVERKLGSPAVRIPLPGEVAVVVYAKARDRLRFEVRYIKDLPDKVRGRLQRGSRSLVQWFDAIREHAASRLPSEQLHQRLEPRDEPTVEALTELVLAVTDVARGKQRSKRDHLLRELLRQGAVTATANDGEVPEGILRRLAARGFLEHVRLVKRDAIVGRRYRLAPRYAGVVGKLT